METVRGVLAAISLFVCLRLFFLETYSVEGRSMEPSIPSQGIVLINKLAYGLRMPGSRKYLFQWGHPEQEDIILVKDPITNTLSIKRCIRITPYGFFVQGDNLSFSVDSRLYGSIPIEQVWGKVILTIPGRGK
ncbi:MAG: signal peptidase I [Spirochaetes bacterium]|nr:signal peptidase I [Spirochaetota bacterium]